MLVHSTPHAIAISYDTASSSPSVSSTPLDRGIFQQDNVRFHTTPETVTYLHEKGVTLIEWPPWSPDLNPIENLWNVLKARVYARFPQTMEEMEQFIREEWAATDLKFISHICRSMPRRLQIVSITTVIRSHIKV